MAEQKRRARRKVYEHEERPSYLDHADREVAKLRLTMLPASEAGFQKHCVGHADMVLGMLLDTIGGRAGGGGYYLDEATRDAVDIAVVQLKALVAAGQVGFNPEYRADRLAEIAASAKLADPKFPGFLRTITTGAA